MLNTRKEEPRDPIASAKASEDGTPIRARVDRQRGERLGAQRVGIYLPLWEEGRNRIKGTPTSFWGDLWAKWAKPLVQQASQAKSTPDRRGRPITKHGEPYDGKLSRTVLRAAMTDPYQLYLHNYKILYYRLASLVIILHGALLRIVH